jgi:hypothetical protein
MIQDDIQGMRAKVTPTPEEKALRKTLKKYGGVVPRLFFDSGPGKASRRKMQDTKGPGKTYHAPWPPRSDPQSRMAAKKAGRVLFARP